MHAIRKPDVWHGLVNSLLTNSVYCETHLYCVGVGLVVSEQFRELEKPVSVRRKDVILMATVTSFQALSHPGKMELRQFAELFQPLFQASSLEARRDAVAALSQSDNLPGAVALFIACQPISIAAPFLASSPTLTDELLILIARTQGAEHAKAIVKRERLSPIVIDALVGLRHSATGTGMGTGMRLGAGEAKTAARAATPSDRTAVLRPTGSVAPSDAQEDASPSLTRRIAMKGAPVMHQALADPIEEQRLKREELLRQKLKELAHHFGPRPGDRLGKRTITPIQEALLVRFARAHDAVNFATTLADVLSSSRWLAERILLDISGRQLATTLIGVATNPIDSVFVLHRLYPHLAQEQAGISRAETLIGHLDPEECETRIESWHRADCYTFGGEQPVAGRPEGRSQTGAADPPEALSTTPVSPEVRRAAG